MFWVRIFPATTGGWLAYSPDFDAITQGATFEEARSLSADLLANCLIDLGELGTDPLTPETAVLPPEQLGTPAGRWEQISPQSAQ